MTAKTVRLAGDPAGDPPGACFITNQQTGQQECHFIPKSECDQRQGVFVGGLCPPSAEAVMMAKVAAPGKAKKATAAKKAAAKAMPEAKKARKAKKAAKSIKAPKTKKASKAQKPKEIRKTPKVQKKKNTK
jgi:hypothetical protein